MRTSPTTEEFFADYLRECKNASCLRPATIAGYETVFELFLRLVPEANNIDSLSPEILDKFFEILRTRERIVGKNKIVKGVRNSTIKTYWTKLNSFFNWLVKNEIIATSPLAKKKRPYVVYNDHRAISDNDIDKIYGAIVRKSRNNLILRRDFAIVNLLLLSGIRRGELLGLRVRDVDFDKKLITINGETSKSKESRDIPMHDSLISSLKDYFKERKEFKTEYLIVSTSEDRNLTSHGLNHWVKSLKKSSGVKFHIHKFRHTFATKLAKKNVNSFNMQRLMGHKTINMTMKYTRSLNTAEMGEDINKL